MPTLVIDPLPEVLHARLKQAAAAHQRSLEQESIALLEMALDQAPSLQEPKTRYWAERKLLPEYEALLTSGALDGGTNSTEIISEEREAR
jgi:plasmid stability protein